MSNLQQRQEKIQAKRKQTSWREFLMAMVSWRSLMFYRTDKWIAKYPQEKWREMNVVSLDDFKKDIWEWLYSLEYSDRRSFLDTFKDLYYNYPSPVVNQFGINENTTWGDNIRGAKNIYLSIIAWDMAENVLYTFKWESNVINILNGNNITYNCENIYYSKTVRSSYNTFFSKFIYNSSNIWFSDNLVACKECLFCHNLQNQEYYINNIPYSKEEYFSYKEDLLKKKDKFEEYYHNLSSKGNIRLCDNSYGHSLFNCHEVVNAYEVSNVNRARNILYCDWWSDSSDCYDVLDSCTDRTHHLYAVMWQAFGDHIYCSDTIVESSYIYYSYKLQDCSFCLGCVHLKNKSYCILNKQYSKEERYTKIDEIFTQMEKDWQLWEFFPATMNPFYFNDTAAYLIDPSFTKEEVTKLGYLRRDEPIKVDIPEWAVTVKSSELGQFESVDERGERKLDETVCKRVIIDENSDAYRIIPMELEFLQKHGLPLPRKHWLTRMKENFRIR